MWAIAGMMSIESGGFFDYFQRGEWGMGQGVFVAFGVRTRWISFQ